jgi:hypothetical protein
VILDRPAIGIKAPPDDLVTAEQLLARGWTAADLRLLPTPHGPAGDVSPGPDPWTADNLLGLGVAEDRADERLSRSYWVGWGGEPVIPDTDLGHFFAEGDHL